LNARKFIVPVVDVRKGGFVRHAMEGRMLARAIRDQCFASFPRPARPIVSVLDEAARRWLARSRSPYVAEIMRR
jgi:hypothetical protein